MIPITLKFINNAVQKLEMTKLPGFKEVGPNLNFCG